MMDHDFCSFFLYHFIFYIRPIHIASGYRNSFYFFYMCDDDWWCSIWRSHQSINGPAFTTLLSQTGISGRNLGADGRWSEHLAPLPQHQRSPAVVVHYHPFEICSPLLRMTCCNPDAPAWIKPLSCQYVNLTQIFMRRWAEWRGMEDAAQTPGACHNSYRINDLFTVVPFVIPRARIAHSFVFFFVFSFF